MNSYLSYLGILMKDFKEYAQRKTAELIEASVAKAEQAGRPNRYLSSARTDKERIALDLAARDGITEGLICILRTVEPCMTYQLHRNRQDKTSDLELFHGKCMHLYHYWYDVYFGFMGARIQLRRDGSSHGRRHNESGRNMLRHGIYHLVRGACDILCGETLLDSTPIPK